MTKHLVAALAFVGLGLSVLFADEAKPTPAKPDPAALAKLAAQLGSDRYDDREAATDALDLLGPNALDVLRKAAKSQDLETRRRAGDLIERIEKRLESAELTQPKMVRLVFTDTPVNQAVQDVARKTGFPLQIEGDQTKLANRKITIDTGDVPFWQAIDQFCEKAGLVERGSVALQENTNPTNGNNAYVTRVVYADGGRGPRAEMPLVFLDGKPPAMPTCYGGAVRVRILPRTAQAGGTPKNPDGGTLLTVEISPEPKFGLRNILSVRVETVLDDRGNELKAPPPYIYGRDDYSDFEDLRMGGVDTIYVDGIQRGDLSTRVPIRLHVPDGVKKLKEVRGSVAADVMTLPMPLLTMDNILDAAGETVDGKNGGSLKVSEVKRDDKGQVMLKVTVEKPPTPQPVGFGGRVRAVRRLGGRVEERSPNAVAAVGSILSLIDDKGQSFKLAVAEEKVLDEQTRGKVEYVLTFQPTDGAGKPTKLVYLGRRRTTIDVPFVLKDVPVP